MIMRIPLLTMVAFFFFSCAADQQKEPEYLVLNGATVFDGQGNTIVESVIVIKDGRIKSIGDQKIEIPANSEVIDTKGKFITPGLIDAHMHFAQTGFFDGRPDVVDVRDSLDFQELQLQLQANPESYYEAYLRSGVTAVYDVGGFHWSIARQDSAEQDLSAPHVAAAGPLLSGFPEERLATFNTEDQKQMIYLSSPAFGREKVIEHTGLGSTGIKIWGVRLDDVGFMEGLKAVAEETKAQGNKLIVHATDLDQAKEALRLGAKVLVHSVDNVEVDEEFIELAKVNDVIYLPTMTVVRGYLNAFRSLKGEMEITDPNNVLDERAKSHFQSSEKFFRFYQGAEQFENRMEGFEKRITASEEIMAINLKKLHEAGIVIAVATDAGNPGTLHGIAIYDEMEAMQKAGIAAADLITMATKNGASAMERSADFGTLENGKMADLIILENDPSSDISNMRSITHVMRGGQLKAIN